MLTQKELAKKFRVKCSTLRCRIWDAKIAPSRVEVKKGTVLNLYDARAERAIRSYLKERPIHKTKGRPKIPKGKK